MKRVHTIGCPSDACHHHPAEAEDQTQAEDQAPADPLGDPDDLWQRIEPILREFWPQLARGGPFAMTPAWGRAGSPSIAGT